LVRYSSFYIRAVIVRLSQYCENSDGFGNSKQKISVLIVPFYWRGVGWYSIDLG